MSLNHTKVGKSVEKGRMEAGSAKKDAGLQPQDAVELTVVLGEERIHLQAYSLWPTVLPDRSAYNTAEYRVQGRDLRGELWFKPSLPGRK